MDTSRLKDFFTGLQARIVAELEAFDGQPFRTDDWERPGRRRWHIAADRGR